MANEPPQILLTGATGFIGGTVLASLLASTHPLLQNSPISVLLRDSDGARSALLTQTYGSRVTPVPFGDQDDSAHVEEVASQHDVVINTTMGFHLTFGESLVRGLARRSLGKHRAPFMIHTSGTTNVADRPLTGTAHPEREFDDANATATYDWESAENAHTPYDQRTAELAVVDTGVKTGVQTVVIMSPTIYGVGSGLFNRHSMQIPRLTRQVLKHGEGLVIGDGKGIWDNVHVEDLGALYVLVLERYLDGHSDLPTGREGIIFSGSRRHSWREVSENVTNAVYAKGKVKSTAITELDAAKTDELFGDARRAELGLASNSKTVASVARRIGWQPKHGDESWRRGFEEELEFALANP